MTVFDLILKIVFVVDNSCFSPIDTAMLASSARLLPVCVSGLLPEATFQNCKDILFSSCRYNSFNIQPGDLYIAFEDPSVDDSCVAEALARGACGVVVRQELFSKDDCPALKDAPICLVSNPHAAYAQICQALYGYPSESMRVIGVTGTRGKRVVNYLVSVALARHGYKTGVITQQGVAVYGGCLTEAFHEESDEQIEAYNNFCALNEFVSESHIDMISPDYMGPSSVPVPPEEISVPASLNFRNTSASDLTNMPPKKTAYWLSRMKQLNCTDIVMEAPQAALDKANLSGINFTVGCVTRHRPYKSAGDFGGVSGMRENAASRSKLIDAIREPGGFAVVNADDACSRDLLRDHAGPALTFGLNKTAQVQGLILEQSPCEQLALITAGSQTLPLATRIVGAEYLSCCLCAIAACLTMDMKLVDIINIIQSVERIPGYMQRVEAGQEFQVFLVHGLEEDDDPLLINLKTLREIVRGRIILVLNDTSHLCLSGTDQDFDFSVLNVDTDRIILVNRNKGLSPEEKTQTPLFVQLKRLFGRNFSMSTNRQLAINQAILYARNGDCVVVAGDDNMFSVEQPEYLSDEEIVQQALYVDLPRYNNKF